MTSPDTLKALAAELREIESSTIFNNKGDGNSITQAAALLESLASADEGVQITRFDLNVFGEMEPCPDGGYVEHAEHLAALSAQSTAADEMAVALRGWVADIEHAHDESLDEMYKSSRSILRGTITEMQAALAAHEAKHGGK